MDPQALAAAKEKLALAKAKFVLLRRAKDLATLTVCWSEFLSEIQRVFSRLRKATMLGPSKGWFDKIEHERTTDPLLSYVRHARNAEEHGINAITQIQPAGAYGVASTGPGIHAHFLSFGEHGRLERAVVSPLGGGQVFLLWSPQRVALAPVVDRGIKYYPPFEHLGKSLPGLEQGWALSTIGPSLVVVADLAYAYVDRAVAEAGNFALLSPAPPPKKKRL